MERAHLARFLDLSAQQKSYLLAFPPTVLTFLSTTKILPMQLWRRPTEHPLLVVWALTSLRRFLQIARGIQEHFCLLRWLSAVEGVSEAKAFSPWSVAPTDRACWQLLEVDVEKTGKYLPFFFRLKCALRRLMSFGKWQSTVCGTALGLTEHWDSRLVRIKHQSMLVMVEVQRGPLPTSAYPSYS